MAFSTNYENLSLSELAEKLDTDFYRPISEQCITTILHLTTHCNKEIINFIIELMHAKQGLLMGYLKTLAEKSSTGHDCSTCSGGCDMGHAERIIEIKQSHIAITDYITGININEQPDLLLPVTDLLTTLLRVEAEVLIPQIWNAQKKINVAG